MSRQLKNLKPQKARVVVEHARRQASRGRKPAMSYSGINNPKLALIAAKQDLSTLDEDLARWANSNGHEDGDSHISVAKNDDGDHIIIHDPALATIVAGYEAMLLAQTDEEESANAA